MSIRSSCPKKSIRNVHYANFCLNIDGARAMHVALFLG